MSLIILFLLSEYVINLRFPIRGSNFPSNLIYNYTHAETVLAQRPTFCQASCSSTSYYVYIYTHAQAYIHTYIHTHQTYNWIFECEYCIIRSLSWIEKQHSMFIRALSSERN